jgi:hypothetical protein
MNRKKIAQWLFLGILAISLFVGCGTPPEPESTPPEPEKPVLPLPPLRPLTREILTRVTDPKALQYYISTWVILDYEGIPDYPDTIEVISREIPLKEPFRGADRIRYDSAIYREIFIKEQTGGELVKDPYADGPDKRLSLEIGFEQRNDERILKFKEDPTGEYFYLDPPGNGTEIHYGGLPYRQRMRGRPLLLVRTEENIESTIRLHTAVEGRKPAQSPESPAGEAPPKE